MMRNIYLPLFVMALTISGCSTDIEPNSLTEKERQDGWELLFDGQSLEKWKTFNGGGVTGWKIIDGILHNSGEGSDYGGDIITWEEFDNFELYLEWKIAPKSNSGIFFHVQEGVVNAIYESGPEYQLIDDHGWPGQLKTSQYSGANYDMHAPENANTAADGGWNRTRLIVKGPHVEHWLNGRKVVEYELWSDDWHERRQNSKWNNMPYYGASKKGHIGLQDHGGLTMFRNIKIKRLQASSPAL
jgi:uncharacterized protein YceK